MKGDEKSGYYTKTKFMNDYSFIFQEELKCLEGDTSKEAEDVRRNIKGRYIKENFEANKRFSSVESFK